MRCQRAQQRLMAYHDGELSRAAARRMEKHLESCTECGPLLERLQLADYHAGSAVDSKGMAGLPDMVPPDERYWESFTARVLDRVEEDAATRAPESHKPRRNWNFIIPRMAPAFSIALVVLVAAGVLIKIGDPIPVPKTPVTYMESAPEKPENSATVGEKEISPEKREALATPDVVAETPGAVTGAAPAPVVQEVLPQKTRDQEAVPSVPVTMEGAVVSIGEVEKADQVEEKAAVLQAELPRPFETEGILATEDVAVPSSSLTATALKEAPSLASDVLVQTFETLEEQKEAVAFSIPDAPAEENPTEEIPAEESRVAASGVKDQDSSVSSGETGNTFVSTQHYRGPEDQLIHARNLAKVRKFWESEQVLKDLLSQRPLSPLQAEASILLVKVLASLNRTGEAQRILDDARARFPASEMIQTFDLKQEGQDLTR